MAILTMTDQQRTLTDATEIQQHLASVGITCERWEPSHPVADDAPAETVLDAYAAEIERLKREGGYVTADVINITADMPGLDAMLYKFKSEHWHDEDEVRFIIRGRGLFHIRPQEGPVLRLEVDAGDLVRVPRGTWHWFDLCSDRQIRAIRLFQDPAGWTPYYTGSGVDKQFEPLCFGPNYLPGSALAD
jgi:1,2-dihydroxy-3-keto-5-methylthiopentene dioxygenase